MSAPGQAPGRWEPAGRLFTLPLVEAFVDNKFTISVQPLNQYVKRTARPDPAYLEHRPPENTAQLPPAIAGLNYASVATSLNRGIG